MFLQQKPCEKAKYKHNQLVTIAAYVVILDVRPGSDLPVELLTKSFQEFLALASVLPGPSKISMLGLFCIADIEMKVSRFFYVFQFNQNRALNSVLKIII